MISKATRLNGSLARLTRSGAFAWFGLLLLPACSTDFLTDGVITITTGQESDAWTAEPAAKKLRIDLVQSTRTTLAEVPAPVTQVSIGTDGPERVTASFDASGFDADGNVVMSGSTVPVQILSFNGARITLFMGRSGGLSRAPEELVFASRHPKVTVQYGNYLLISGGDDARADLDLYDMVRWRVAPVLRTDDNGVPTRALPKVPESWAVAGSKLLLVDRQGPTWVDIWEGVQTVVTVPAGLDFADVVGGETIGAPNQPQYIVGATRTTGEPTNVVVRVDPDGSLHVLKLGTPRLAAAATIVSGQLLVVGGADSGAGAEISNAAGTAFSELPFPADATQGAALIAQDPTTALLVGGRDPATDEIAGFRTMDLSCSEECSQVRIAKPVDFARPRLFPLGKGQSLLVGEDPETGQTHVFTFDTGVGHALTEFALRVPRSGASAFMAPNGQVGVLGGDALADGTPAKSVELFFPLP
ncbi:MAG TPA: hypothetical protein VJV79_14410 [Polyangiaceae bacterium]|nr:hypothetical protein [Polyangiaceae bacterium]